tara:strand:+ start:14881 stop:16239 length:1359 start_codon:yes stop_codon:yes gene_type:complete
MGLTIQDLLSGDIVKPRPQQEQNSNAGLGTMLAFLSQGQNQHAAALPQQPNYAEMYKVSPEERIAREKQKAHLASMQQMKELIGTPEVGYRESADPLSSHNVVTQKGSGYLQDGDRNKLAARMMGLDDPTLQQAGAGIFDRLIPTATKAGVGVIPFGSTHEQDPDTGTWWWVTPNGDSIRDMSAMTQNQQLLQDPEQVKTIAGSKIAPTIQEATLPSGAQQKMTAEELLDLRKRGAESRKTATDNFKNGSIDRPMFDSMMHDIDQWDPSGQASYDKETDIGRAKSDEVSRVAAFDLPVMKNDIQNMRTEVTKAIEDLKTGGGQKQFLPGVNRWLDNNIVNDPSANRATRIQGSKVLESLKAIGGNDSNADLQFSQLISGLDPYYTDKKTLQENYEKLLTGLNYKEKVLENKYGGYVPNAPTINSNAPKEVRTGKTINGVYYKDVAEYNARRK